MARTKRKPIQAEVLERIQTFIGKPKQHTPTQMVEPVIERVVPRVRPDPVVTYEHYTGYEYVLSQSYYADATFAVCRAPHLQANIVRQYQRRWNKRQNRSPLLVPPCPDLAVIIGAFGNRHTEYLYILPPEEHPMSTPHTSLEVRFRRPVGTIGDKVDIP